MSSQKKAPKGDLSKKKPEQKQPPKPKPEQKQPPKQAEQPKLSMSKLQEEVNTKIAALTERILTQDKQQEEANAKITALANAVGSLNENFTKFIDTLKAQAAPAQPPQTIAGAHPGGGDDKPKPGPNILAPEEPEQITPLSAPDKLLAWGELLAKFAQAGGGGGGGAQTDAIPNSLVQLINSLKVMGELRKTFLSELKEMIGFAKGIETTVKSPPAGSGGTTHLPEE